METAIVNEVKSNVRAYISTIVVHDTQHAAAFFCSCPQSACYPNGVPQRPSRQTTVRIPMPLEIVYDAKEWWDTTRRLWLRNVLCRESKGLPPQPLTRYAAQRALLLHQELPPDPWGAKARRPASMSSNAAVPTTTSSVILPVCQASMVGGTKGKNTRNKIYKQKTNIGGSTRKTSQEQPRRSSMLPSGCTEKLETFCGMLWT